MAWRNGDVLEIPPSRSVFVEFGTFGALGERTLPALRTPHELTDWTLSFPSGWGAPEKVALERPMSWTEIPGFTREAKAFAGTVTYEVEFDCSDASAPVELDLGRVESIAKVYVNDVSVRTLWCEPYACDITDFVKTGWNDLRIEVVNTWRNRVIFDLGQPVEKRQTWILHREGYNPSANDPFVPAGLLGPVSLQVCK